MTPPPKHRPGASLGLDCRTAFQRIAHECIAEMRRRKNAARTGDVDAIHRMRIALTKLRSARKFFAAMTRDDSWPKLKLEIRWINSVLGAARDSDVATGYSASSRASRKLIKKHVTESHRLLTRALSSQRYQRLIPALAGWIDAGPWVTEQDTDARMQRMRPLADYAKQRLAQWKKKLGSKADKLSTERQRHLVRIDAKRFRYMSETLNIMGVRESGKQARARRAAARVQSALGDLRDIRRFHRVFASPPRDRRSEQRRRAKLLREAAKSLRTLA